MAEELIEEAKEGFTSEDLRVQGRPYTEPENTSGGFTLEELTPVKKNEAYWKSETSFISDAKLLSGRLNTVDVGSGSKEFMESTQGTNHMFQPQLSIEELQAGMAEADERFVPREVSDEEYTQGAMEALGNLNWNTTDLGLKAYGFDEWSDEEQMALIRSMERYEGMDNEAQHYGRALKAIASDPSTYVGLGIFAQAAKGLVLKSGASKLLKGLMSKSALGAGVVAGTEGAIYSAADDVSRQYIENKADISKQDNVRTAKQSAIGFGAALTLGWGVTKILTPKPKGNDTPTAEVNAEDDVITGVAEDFEINGVDEPEFDIFGPPKPDAEVPKDIDVDAIERAFEADLEDRATGKREFPTDKEKASYGFVEIDEIVDDFPEMTFGKTVDSEIEDVIPDDAPNFTIPEEPAIEGKGIPAEPTARDGDFESMNNGENIGDHQDPWTHLYEGKLTFNVDKLETSDDVKDLLEASSAHWEEVRMREADKNGPNGHETLEVSRQRAEEEAARLLEETGADVSKLMDKFKDDANELRQIRYRAQTLRKINLTLGERVWELADKQVNGVGLLKDEQVELVEKSSLFANTMELTKLTSREFSRGLGNFRMIMKGDPELLSGLGSGKTNMDINLLAKTVISMTNASKTKKGGINLRSLKKATDKLSDPTFMTELIRFRSAMMLSGPSTLEAAAISNFSKMWTEPFVEWWGHLGRGDAKKVARRRAWAQYAGNRRYFASSWKQAAKAWKNGQHVTDPFVTKMEDVKDSSLDNMSWARRNLWERGVHQAHLALLFLDEGIKANRARSLIYADTVSEFMEMEMKAATAKVKTDLVVSDGIPNITPEGDAFEALLERNLRAKIDKNGRVKDPEILREIREATYTSDLEGELGEIINKLANAGGGAGRLFVLPFVRAPLNIVSESMMYFPGTGFISRKQKNIMDKGSPVAKAKLKARKQIGLGLIAGLMYAAEDEIITGSGPFDYKQNQLWRESGYEPNSILINGEYYSYAKLGPISIMMGIVADSMWYMNHDTHGTNLADQMTEVLGHALATVTVNILNKSYFQSVQQIMEGLQDPDKMGVIIQNWFVAFTPNVLAQMNSDENVREASSWAEKFQRRLPGMSEKLGKQYDLYGRPIMKPSKDAYVFAHVFKNRTKVEDSVASAVYRLSEGLDRAILTKVSYALGSSNVDFRDVYDIGEKESVYAKYNRIVGELKDPYSGNTMHEELALLVASEEFRRAPNSFEGDISPPRVKMIQSIVNGYRTEARDKLHDESPAYRRDLRERESRIDAIFQ